jgi:hypothetical protein
MTTISSTAEHATEHVRHAASHAGTSLLDLSTQVFRFINGVREAQGRGVETVLDRLGLQRRQSALGPVLWFAAGAVAAGTAVLLLSPESGKKVRQRMASFLRQETDAQPSRSVEAEPRVEVNETSAGHNGAKHPTG